jgi:hypothetical protein
LAVSASRAVAVAAASSVAFVGSQGASRGRPGVPAVSNTWRRAPTFGSFQRSVCVAGS